jgi:hypothetical protein
MIRRRSVLLFQQHRSKPESKTCPQIANRLGFSSARSTTWLILRGLAISAGIAIFAFALRQIPGVASFSPMILAVMLGAAVHNLIGVPGKLGVVRQLPIAKLDGISRP